MANTNRTEPWVEQSLGAVSPDASWEPDVARGFERLNHSLGRPPAPGWTWPALVAAAGLAAAALIVSHTGPVNIGTTPVDAVAPHEGLGRLLISGSPLLAPAERVAAPPLQLLDPAGAELGLLDYHGDVVLLNFWATWCVPCVQEMPLLEELSQRLNERGLTVLGVSLDEEGWQAIVPFLARNDIRYPIAVPSENMLEPPYDAITALPTSLIIDRSGRIASVHLGIVDSSIEAQIKQLLEE
jgi:thiol-disulfide isomerase/thioredoxin